MSKGKSPAPIRSVVKAYGNGLGPDGVHKQWRAYVYGDPIGVIEWSVTRKCYVLTCFIEFLALDGQSLIGLYAIVRRANDGVDLDGKAEGE